VKKYLVKSAAVVGTIVMWFVIFKPMLGPGGAFAVALALSGLWFFDIKKSK